VNRGMADNEVNAVADMNATTSSGPSTGPDAAAGPLVVSPGSWGQLPPLHDTAAVATTGSGTAKGGKPKFDLSTFAV
jgi:hypothetical protein